MFVAREHELQVLEKLFTSDSFEMVVLYGRRRVGKTALIDELSKINACRTSRPYSKAPR